MSMFPTSCANRERHSKGRPDVRESRPRRSLFDITESPVARSMRFAEKQMLSGAQHVQALMRPRHRVLLACFPKSGSTWLRTILSELPGFRTHWIAASSGRGEQELAALRVARASFDDFVAQHHVRYHEDTQRLIDRYRLQPVVLVRDIFDSVISLRDHVRDRWPELPQALVTPEVRELPDDELTDFLIDMAIPWYIDFYVSWTNCANAIRIRYEDLRNDSEDTVTALLQQLDARFGPVEIHRAIEAANGREILLNQALIGRGRQLTPAQRDRIVRMTSYYPSVDFGPIGIPGTLKAGSERA